MTENLLPEIENVGNKEIATFRLCSEAPVTSAPELESNLSRVVKSVNPYLIVIDINQGEPAWLASSLGKFSHFGLDLIVCPTSNASKSTLDALKLLQSAGAEVKANKAGFIN